MADMAENTCVIDGCDGIVYVKARGLCRRHYKRWWTASQSRTCSVDGCDKPHEARDYCTMHLRRWRLYGDPLASAAREDRSCAVEGCGGTYYGAGLCEVHYARRRRHGTTEDMRATRIDFAERFWSRVNKQGPTPLDRPDLGRCWLWTGAPNGSGYGSINTGGSDGAVIGAYVAAVLLSGDGVPPGHEPDHLCYTPLCVRRSHLEVVTAAENKRRAAARRRTSDSR